ncbi:hypothetical protein M0811_05605 [Anaeramoeba ignava]|uniref:Uncharacterized protein n=1 Tax=Anaeramoeba ignava TaxID=1746090 RepID=A0A9Q0LV90_ANAIG|nr:hypothetical protein M0811_05605 [Anaeramoeba ignava]
MEIDFKKEYQKLLNIIKEEEQNNSILNTKFNLKEIIEQNNFFEMCLLFLSKFETWIPEKEIKSNEKNQLKERFDEKEINLAIQKGNAHPKQFIYYIFIFLKDSIKKNKEIILEKEQKSLQNLIALPVIKILCGSVYNRQILFEFKIFDTLLEMIKLIKILFDLLQKLKESNPLLSIYYLYNAQFISLGIIEILKKYLTTISVSPQKIFEMIKKLGLISSLVEFWGIELETRKSFIFTPNQYLIQSRILEILEIAYPNNLLNTKDKFELVLCLLDLFRYPKFSLPYLGIYDNKNQNQNENENRK